MMIEAVNAQISSVLALQVNDTVLTDVQGGMLASASDISPAYPSQKSISLPSGNTGGKVHVLLNIR